MSLKIKFISRPVVAVKPRKYNGPSLEGAREYNSLKKEFATLFADFRRKDLRQLDAFDRVLKKAALVREQVRRVMANKIVTPGRSWAQVVLKGPHNEKPLVRPMVEKELPPWGRARARRDYTLAYNRMEKERAAARLIVEGMAARRPIRVFPKHREFVKLVDRASLKQALNSLRKERKALRQPKEVSSFDFRCYEEKPEIIVEETKVVEPCYFTLGVRSTSVKQVKVRQPKTQVDENCESERFEFKPTRFERRTILIAQLSRTSLGQVLMAAILKRQAERRGEDFNDILQKLQKGFESETLVEPEMDPEGVVGQTATSETKQSNTVVDNLNPVDLGQSIKVIDGFKTLAISRENQIFSTLVDRWILLGDVTWGKDPHGSRLKFGFNQNAISFNIPGDIIRSNKDSPNAQLFLTHRWSRFTTKLRFCLNSNPFQVGCCVPSVLYKTSGERTEVWDNIYSALQRNHCKLNAGSSNDAELIIPYRNLNSMICLKNKENIAQVSITVLNPLTATETVSQQCSITVYACFEDTEFSGMISRSLGEESVTPQMDSIADVMNAGSDLIRTIRGDNNRDNPPLPIQPGTLIPQGLPSFSYMDGVPDPVNMLRADSRGQTPHVDMSDEMNPYIIARKWGFLQTVNWKTSDAYGSDIVSLDVVPLMSYDKYQTSVLARNIVSKVYPPVAFISALYGRWRGDLEFKFEIFASKFHTGRLIVGCVPFPENTVVTVDQLKYSAYKIFDLNDSTELIFRAPWHWRNSCVPTYLARSYITPSKIFVKIVNPLIAIDSVPTSIYVNVYIRAADNFELFIPRPSILSPSFADPLIPPSSEYLKMYNLEDKVWTDWRSAIPRKTGYALTMNIDSVANGWEGFIGAKLGQVYELGVKTTKNLFYKLLYKDKNQMRFVRWAVYDPALSTNSAHGLVICINEAHARKFALEAQQNNPDWSQLREDHCPMWIEQGPVAQISSDNKIWVDTDNLVGNTPVWLIHDVPNNVSDVELFEVVEPQGDTAPITLLETPTVTSSQGLVIFGERTPDLKSLCRRYIHFGTVQAKTCTMGNPRDCPYTAKLNINPMRHVKPETSWSYENRWRNGTITTIGSMFRMWRGSLRLRFVVVGNPPEGTTLYVQHRFDMTMEQSKTIVPGNDKVLDRNDIMNTQYATFAQPLGVNSTCTVEIPYYSEREGLSVIPGANGSNAANGVALLWIHSKIEANIHIEVFYSFGDDCRYQVFQGCPASLDLNELNPEPQMDIEKVEAQGLFETIKQSVSAPKKVAEMADSVKNTAESLTENLKRIGKMTEEFTKSEKKLKSPSFKEKIKNYATDKILEKVGDEIYSISSKYFEILTHMIYAVMSPTKKVVGWALFNIYKKIFGMSFDGVSIFVKYVGDLWDKVKCSTQRPQEESIEPQSEGTIGSYASLLFTSIATFCKLKVSPPSSWKGISDGLFTFSQAARSGSYVSQFIKDNIELFQRIYDRFLGLFGVASSNYKLIAGLQDERLKDWLTQSDIILSAQYQEKLLTDPTWSQKAFELAVVGRVLERTMSEDPITPARLLQYVRANVVALKKIEKKLISRKVFSGARYTPSCIWIGGQAGTGKTFFMQELASELAKFHKYSGGQLYHTMTAGVKYFDAYDGQLMIVLDDFLAGPISGASELGVQFLQLKSCNAFNMPKSAVEDKDQLLNFTDLGITSNQLFVENCPGVHDNDAYNRRRDIVLEFKFIRTKNDIVVTPDNLKELFTREELAKLEHLEISYIKNPTDPRSVKISIERGNSLKQAVLTHVLTELKEYHRTETLNYQDRCKAVLDVLEQAPAEGSFETVFKKYSFAIEKFNKMSLSGSETFSHWLKDTIEASTSRVVPEMDTEPVNPFAWPTVMSNRCDSLDRDGLLEPFKRENMPAFKPRKEYLCLHDQFDFEFANFDKELNVFYSDRYLVSEDVASLALSVPAGPCRIRSNADLITHRACSWYDPVRKSHFLNQYIFSPCIKSDLMQKVDVAKATQDWSLLDDEPAVVVEHLKKIFTVNEKATENVKLLAVIEEEQEKLRQKFQQIGTTVVPKRPKWRTFCSMIWNVLLDVLLAIHTLIGILLGAFLICSFVSFLTIPTPVPQIHPSGDFKTLKNSKTIRARSIRLLEGEGNEVSLENDIVDACAYKRNNGGIYKKIINNSFFLIGKVPLEGDKFVIYKARCLGLYNKKFICLEHYITYFKSVGVKTVAVVYHDAKGMVEYKLDEIQFSWTSEGYGVGELPKSAPKQFANICKYMPSESFDMTYPRKLKIFEIWNDNVVEHLVEAELFSTPVKVTGTIAEGSWTISQGFKYAWGGKGCCGSLVIAEEMACPLVAIHTAGVQGRKGFAELLFRETFETQDIILEYVVPNMKTSDSVYGLEGFYYQVGQLDPDMAVRGSMNTRIEPSEIQGVFPVLTEPAPLTSKDERLESPKDILKIGASKRCDPPKEFSPLDVNTAFLNYWNLIKTEVKPVRANPGVLTMTQAVEGLPLAGYDAIEMSTSEGYPWVNMRPKGSSNKSWMFERDQYPDGRIKITGVVPELKRVFDLKEEMRSRGVVPCSYFTCCLKDARILKEKVPIPGKTRVFEACPIDLTIAYRQYNLDFTAALAAARLRAENSIGINPDGPEWTDLANWLLEFSDKIITADYSAFGPRLNHAVLENSFNITTEWYELIEECDEEEKQRRYITREVLREEIVHAPTVAKDLVFIPTCGMPSGFPDTVTKNTQSNSQYIRLAFLNLARKYAPHYSDLYWFTKLVRLVTNGDDLIAAVKDEVIEWFNNETIIEFFASYNIKMTDALKSGKIRPFCSLEEATYLKRGFKKHPKREGQWLAPLERSSITDTANWVWRSVDRRGASLINSEMCCRLAYTQGPDYYNSICSSLASRWEQEGVTFCYPPWSLLDNHVWDNAPGPHFSF